MTNGNGKPMSARQQIAHAASEKLLKRLIEAVSQLRVQRGFLVEYDRGYQRGIDDALKQIRKAEAWKS